MASQLFAMLLVFISLECRMEQRAAIKVFVRAGDSVKTAINKIQAAWTDHALSVPQIRFWF